MISKVGPGAIFNVILALLLRKFIFMFVKGFLATTQYNFRPNPFSEIYSTTFSDLCSVHNVDGAGETGCL